MELNKYFTKHDFKIIIYTLLFLVICCVPHVITGADDSESSVVSSGSTDYGDGYFGILYDNSNGLPTSEANDIIQTSEGFIWIGSYSGLIRYDGNTFERIDSTTGIASVVSLYADSSNRLWVGTNDCGLALMQGDEVIRMYSKADGLKSLSVRSVVEGNDGYVYVATTHGMVKIDKELKLIAVDEPQINDEYIRKIAVSEDGILYGVTMDGDVFTMKNGKLTGFYTGESLGVSDIHYVIPDNKNSGWVYIGTKGSVLYHTRLDGVVVDKIDMAPLQYMNSVNQIDDEIWVCADNGIGVIVDGKITILDNMAMNSSIERVMKDYQGNVWFASSKQGVMKIVRNRFLDLSDRYNLEPTVVNATLYDGDRLYIGAKNTGLTVVEADKVVDKLPLDSAYYADGTPMAATDLFDILGQSRIRSIVKDSKGNIWFSTFNENALVRYDGHNVLCFNEKTGLPSSRVRAVYEKSDGTYMVVCTGGLVIIKDDKVVKVYDDKSGIGNTELLTVTEGFNGDMIMGTDGDGIYIIKDAETNVIHMGIESGLSSEVIMRIKRSEKYNIYWIVSSNSIAYMDKDYNIHTIQAFPYSNNFDLYENSSGKAWILSSNGIYVADVDELLQNDKIETNFYGFEDGLPTIATANSYSFLTDDGDLYIAGTTGVAKVNIDDDPELDNNVRMYIPYVVADGKRIYPDSEGRFIIPHNTDKLDIYGYVFTYSLMNPDISYSLEGFDKHAVTVKRSDFGKVSYTNLKGGNYSFVMKIVGEHGGDNAELKVVIIKKKAFYETYWFRFLMIALIIALITVLVRMYIYKKTKNLLKKEKENKLLIREIVEAFAKTIDMKDKYTNGHSTRVAEYTALLARELGYDEDTVEKYYNIALMHDIGKIGIPASVLNKDGKLTDEEYAIIKSHAEKGYNVLKNISIMPELATGAGAHHERPDGKGYPNGLKGDEIPRVAQIIAVADTFDAMYSNRPYRKRMNFEKAVSIIKEVSGTQLTSDVVDAFLRLVEKGEFKAPDDNGGGTVDDINNIHKSYEKEKN